MNESSGKILWATKTLPELGAVLSSEDLRFFRDALRRVVVVEERLERIRRQCVLARTMGEDVSPDVVLRLINE